MRLRGAVACLSSPGSKWFPAGANTTRYTLGLARVEYMKRLSSRTCRGSVVLFVCNRSVRTTMITASVRVEDERLEQVKRRRGRGWLSRACDGGRGARLPSMLHAVHAMPGSHRNARIQGGVLGHSGWSLRDIQDRLSHIITDNTHPHKVFSVSLNNNKSPPFSVEHPRPEPAVNRRAA